MKRWLTALDRPYWPFFLMALSPIVTLPASLIIIVLLPDCGLDEPWWQSSHIRLALLPELVDLALFAWLLSNDPKVRLLAAIAGVLGIVRIGVPQVLLSFDAASSSGQTGDPSCAVSIFFLMAMILAMFVVWGATTFVGGALFYGTTRGSR